jgi:hypothetical protein
MRHAIVGSELDIVGPSTPPIPLGPSSLVDLVGLSQIATL